MFNMNTGRSAFALQRHFMDLSHSIAPAAASGSLSALLVALAQHLRAPELPLEFHCPNLGPEPSLSLLGRQLELVSLVIGLVIGLLLWPLFELLYLWQAFLKARIRAQLRRLPPTLYKILE